MDSSNVSPSSSFESLDAFDDDDLDASFYSKISRRNGTSFSHRFFSDVGDDEAHHFLDCCSLCSKRLAGGSDIYMYRGDTPFCSEDCRQEQIEIDAAEEKRHKKSMMIKSNETSLKSQKIQARAAGAVTVG